VDTGKLTFLLSQLTKKLFINLEFPMIPVEKCIILKLILRKYLHTSKDLIPYQVTVTERRMVTIIKVIRDMTRGKKAGTFRIQVTLSITAHTQYYRSHSVNGSDFSVVVQYVFYVYGSVLR